ncbi:hypothetical protein E2C01_017689 [Portunus trituberculatus]|uniref:Uncharacterized protein n=1 Tax=Portunus trituberculatus TaxID=210409 RepID=A0A5B7DSM3_PORTR|nr:hypothetical protein [Portunus trituberculatus]
MADLWHLHPPSHPLSPINHHPSPILTTPYPSPMTALRTDNTNHLRVNVFFLSLCSFPHGCLFSPSSHQGTGSANTAPKRDTCCSRQNSSRSAPYPSALFLC